MTIPQPDTRKHLVYFADPMCSWCWGFAPVVAGLSAHFRERLPIALMMGGLRPGNRKAMTEQDKAYVRDHWTHVHKASGQPFDFAFFDRDHFVYDTEPACRAIVAMRRIDPDRTLDYLARVQRAFYAEGRDVTRPEVLADLAAEEGLDREVFLAAHASQAARDAVRQDFAATQQTGVTGFPTLAAGYPGRRYFLVTAGFARAAEIADRLDRIHAIAKLE